MPKEKACKICNRIYEGDKCPNCESKEFTNTVKGKIIVLNPEKSEFSKRLGLTKKGDYFKKKV